MTDQNIKQRVTEIIKDVNYSALIKDNLIPDLAETIDENSKLVTSKRPLFVTKNQKFDFFGMLMDYFVRQAFKIIGKDFYFREGTDPNVDDPVLLEKYNSTKTLGQALTASYQIVCNIYDIDPFTKEEINNYIPTATNIAKELIIQWKRYKKYLGFDLSFNQVLNYQYLEGHPDLMTTQAILDIKTVANLKTNSKLYALQVLSYIALARINYQIDFNYVGFILPLQRKIVLFHLDQWDHIPFLQFLNDQIELKINLIERMSKLSLASCNIAYKYGFHIRGSNLLKTIKEHYFNLGNVACQFFVQGYNKGVNQYSDQNAGPIKKYIKKHNIRAFIHAPYTINLCGNKPYAKKLLKADLTNGQLLGCLGVVVHCGKLNVEGKKMNLDTGLDIMEKMIRDSIPYATKKCPLLIETCCGSGTEVLWQFEDLRDFFERFTKSERKYLGLCLDTCHVWAANYNPYEFMVRWLDQGLIPIKLIHFNDAKNLRGSKKDGHQAVGYGYIGSKIMDMVGCLAEQNNIPLVHE